MRLESGTGSTSPLDRDGVELRGAAERPHGVEHARADALGLGLAAGGAQAAPADPGVERPDRAAVVVGRAEDGRAGLQRAQPVAVSTSGSHSRSAAASSASPSSARAHSSQPSWEPAPGTIVPSGSTAIASGPSAPSRSRSAAAPLEPAARPTATPAPAAPRAPPPGCRRRPAAAPAGCGRAAGCPSPGPPVRRDRSRRASPAGTARPTCPAHGGRSRRPLSSAPSSQAPAVRQVASSSAVSAASPSASSTTRNHEVASAVA